MHEMKNISEKRPHHVSLTKLSLNLLVVKDKVPTILLCIRGLLTLKLITLELRIMLFIAGILLLKRLLFRGFTV
jgi:hypothetical protein